MEEIEVDIAKLYTFYRDSLNEASFVAEFGEKKVFPNQNAFKLSFVQPKKKEKLSYLMKSYLNFHYPRLDISEIANFDKNILRFKNSMKFKFEYPDSQGSSQSYIPDERASSDSDIDQEEPIEADIGCSCDICPNENCTQSRRIAELEAELDAYRTFNATVFLALFAIFCKAHNISCRNAEAIISFLKQFVPSFNVPARKKSFFASAIYCLPSLLKLQLQQFIDNTTTLIMQLDGTSFKNGAKVFTMILMDDGLDSVCYNMKAQAGDRSEYLFKLVLDMLGDQTDTVLKKLRFIVSDRARTQLACNRKIIAKAAELENRQVAEVACSLHCAENCIKYATTELLEPETLTFLKTFTKIFGPAGNCFHHFSVYLPWQMHLREEGKSVTVIPEKGNRFISLPMNCRVILENFDSIVTFCKRLKKKPKYQNNPSLDFILRKMTQGTYSLIKFKAQLYLFAGVSTFFILPVWKTTSKSMSLAQVRNFMNEILLHCFRIIQSDTPIRELTMSHQRLHLTVEYTDTAVDFSKDFVEFFNQPFLMCLVESRVNLQEYFTRVKDKYIADQDAFMSHTDFSEQVIPMFLPSSNQQAERSFGIMKNASVGYDFGNLVTRSLLQFNDTLSWVLEQENCAELIDQAMKERRQNKLLHLDLIDSLVSTDFENAFELPELENTNEDEDSENDDSSQPLFADNSSSDDESTMSYQSTVSHMSTTM